MFAQTVINSAIGGSKARFVGGKDTQAAAAAPPPPAAPAGGSGIEQLFGKIEAVLSEELVGKTKAVFSFDVTGMREKAPL